ncbi:PAS domain S-box/diguanylate cyclase GGDEF domain protein [Legionella oakridgensis ATCC 33761 = DSM 21215]|uniref:PAS domain S-box/diguanylate cyclase GGDEF domain protein n=4 Tax=Legionella oakridgensis TaxID=29423 RepID=W0BEB6_9GAMM|nr:PAS domain S-box/diguanylate cyclase GGDEF domain protein [Legionella oakridgensis ATCC 33761 = DSM 21215]KTD37200.1 sensory box (GGDEF/EAL domain) regulatory protein [Legionella oakridgensis]STY20144.1 sensory box (GGDEF/EAL domain) regulatory protein [Legionella longbeachae]
MFAVTFWFIESIIHVYVFHSGTIVSQLFPKDENEFWMRSIIACLIIVFSLTTAHVWHQKNSLKRNLKLALKMFDSLGNGIVITNKQNKIIYVNKKYTEITGYASEEVVGKNPNVLSSGRQNKEFYEKMWSILESKGYWEGEIWNRKKSGELFPEWINISIIKDKRHTPAYYVGVLTDISSRKKLDDITRHYAYYDPLTNLPNRRLFKEELHHEMRHAKRNQQKLAVLFIDLDDFKPINDRYGHHVGDEYLIKFSKFLKDHLRESDVLSRFGGDEFMIVLPNIQTREITAMFIQNLLNAMKDSTIQHEESKLPIIASIGYALYPDDGIDIDALIHQADMNMYEEKAKKQK